VEMVKVHCLECVEDFRLGVWNYNTISITNIFSNFKKEATLNALGILNAIAVREESFRAT